jgi:hypothetical protein
VPDRTELERVRALCLALPEVIERLSHGSQAALVAGEPSTTSCRLTEAYLQIAPKRLVEEAIRARG